MKNKKIIIQKKAQMEIMGLAIVVILIVFGMLFAVRFFMSKPNQTSLRTDYTTTQLTSNMLNTMLNTNTRCNELSIKELLIDAGRDYPKIDCSGESSSIFVNAKIQYLLSEVIYNQMTKEYYFSASSPELTIAEACSKSVLVNGKCVSPQNRARDRKTQFIETDYGTITLILDIYT